MSCNAVSTPYFARKMQTHKSSPFEQNLPPGSSSLEQNLPPDLKFWRIPGLASLLFYKTFFSVLVGRDAFTKFF